MQQVCMVMRKRMFIDVNKLFIYIFVKSVKDSIRLYRIQKSVSINVKRHLTARGMEQL